MDFLFIVVRLTVNAKLLLILPVCKRILQIPKTTVFLAGVWCLQVSEGRHDPTVCTESAVST